MINFLFYEMIIAIFLSSLKGLFTESHVEGIRPLKWLCANFTLGPFTLSVLNVFRCSRFKSKMVHYINSNGGAIRPIRDSIYAW